MQPNYDEAAASGILAMFGIGFFIFIFAISAFFIVCQWKIFTKAGQPGWASIVPVYGFLVYLKIIGKPWWWLLLLIIPFVNFVGIFIILIGGTHALSKSFGKDVGFTVGLIFLGIVFYPILAFDNSIVYIGPGGTPDNLDRQVDTIGTPAI
jgi:hypothetical protein